MFDLALLSNVDKSDSFRSFGMIPMVDLWNNHPDDTEFLFVENEIKVQEDQSLSLFFIKK